MDAWLIHGGKLDAAREAFGGAGADWLDLSTGINPHPWPGADRIATDWRALPDPAALETTAAAHFGTTSAICALPGTEIGLRLLGAMMPDTLHVAPAYRTHAEAFPRGAAIGFDAMEQAIRSGRNVLLANPANPGGRLTEADRLIGLARLARDNGGWLIVDEAFRDSIEGAGLAADAGEDLPLILFRSFGKFFGLAGLRLGFAIGPERIVSAFRARLGAWPVSAAAIAIGMEAYRDIRWIAAMRTRLAEEAAALDAMLARHGFAPVGACPLFRLIETPDASALFARLARRHILTRPFDYAPNWLRIGLPGSAEGLARLDRALAGA
ncbi:MAG: pyridoxal phosphate-dependent class II aminotransferase [Sphingomonas bacterium]